LINFQVLQAEPTTLEDVIRVARVAEEAIGATRGINNDSAVADLTKTVAVLPENTSTSPGVHQTTVSTGNERERSSSPSPRQSDQRESYQRYNNNSNSQRYQNNRRYEPRQYNSRQRTSDNFDPSHTPPERQQRYNDYRYDDRRQQRPHPYDDCASTRQVQSGNDGNMCGNCGYIHEYDNCFAENLECFKCKRRGHILRMCRSNRPQRSHNESIRP